MKFAIRMRGWFLLFLVFFPGSGWCQPLTERAELILTKAAVSLQEGRSEEAIFLLQPILQETPDLPQALLLMGTALNRQDRYGEALSLLERARARNPRLPGLAEEMAWALYHTGSDAEALAVLDESLAQRPPTGRLLYVRGLTLARLGRLAEARRAFEDAAALSPALRPLCLYHTGAISYGLRDYQAARQQLQRAIQAGTDEKMLSSARKILDQIAREENTRRYSVSLSLGFEYDTNVTLQPNDVRVETQVSNKADGRFVLQGYGDYKFIQTPSWELGTTVGFYNSQHLRLHQFDLHGPQGAVYGGYRWGPFQARLKYQYTYYWLDADSYLSQHGAGPEISWTQAPWAKLYAGYLYTHNEYFNLPGRDSFNHRGGFAQYFYWKQDALLRLSYFADAEHATGNDFDYLGHQFGVLGAVRLPWQMYAQGSLEYYLRDYNNRNSVAGRFRDDHRWTVGVELGRRMTQNLDLSLIYTRVMNDSNIDFFEYTRDVIALLLRANF